MAVTVLFDHFNYLNGWTVEDIQVSPLIRKTTVLTPPLGNDVDYTDLFPASYENREIIIVAAMPVKVNLVEMYVNSIQLTMAGKHFEEISFSHDAGYYWTGRCVEISSEYRGGIARITLKLNVKPFKGSEVMGG